MKYIRIISKAFNQKFVKTDSIKKLDDLICTAFNQESPVTNHLLGILHQSFSFSSHVLI